LALLASQASSTSTISPISQRRWLHWRPLPVVVRSVLWNANKIVVHANSATECVWKVEHDRVVGRILDCRSPALVPLRIFASFWPASLPIAPIVHHRAAEQSHARKEVVDCHLRLTRIGDRPIIDLRGGAALRGQCQGNGIDRLDRLVSLPKIISGRRLKTTPVTLPPGRLRLATRPSLTGSLPVPKTIGTVVVAALAASAEGVFPTITATCRPSARLFFQRPVSCRRATPSSRSAEL